MPETLVSLPSNTFAIASEHPVTEQALPKPDLGDFMFRDSSEVLRYIK